MSEQLTPERLREVARSIGGHLADIGASPRYIKMADELFACADAWEAERDTKGNYRALMRCRSEKATLQRRVEAMEKALRLLPPERARYMAQNDYMIDQHFLEDGRALNEYADAALVALEEEKP